MRGAAGRRGPQRGGDSRILLLAVVLGGAVAGLILAFFKARGGEVQPPGVRSALDDCSSPDLHRQRVCLFDVLQSWDRKAGAEGLDPLLGSGEGGAATAASGGAGGGEGGACADDILPVPSAEEALPPELVSLVRRKSVNNEIMLALANGVMICQNTTICWWNGGNILKTWLENLQRIGITNFIVGVLDDETDKYIKRYFPETATFRPHGVKVPGIQEKSHPANKVSTLKYAIVKQLLTLRISVLVSDMDLIYLDDPFKHLHRDADIEGQTDGFTEEWAYGHFGGISDPTMGWGGGGLYFQGFTLNVGCAFIRPNRRTIDLMERIFKRLASSPGWDQQVFNEELLFWSHGSKKAPMCSVRIMDIWKFMNSKIFFRSSRSKFIPGAASAPGSKPVMIHMNYHPDKHKRMLCLVDRYFGGKADACDSMPGGSNPGT